MKNLIVIGIVLFYTNVKAQIGIGTTSPNSTLDIRGSVSGNVQIFSTTYTATGTDYHLIFTGSLATTITLPTAVGVTGRLYTIKNASTNSSVLTIATTSSQTIDAGTTLLLNNAYQTVTVTSDGSNWHIVGYGLPSGSGVNWSQGGNSVAAVTNFGTITNYSLPFITNNIERMRLNTSGNLGINTTSQTEKLQVEGNIRLSGSGRAIFFDATADPYAGIKNVSRANETNELMLFSGNDVSGSFGADRIRLATHEIHFATASTNPSTNSGDATTNFESTTTYPTRMLINQDGNVGIGTSTFNATYPERLIVDAGSTVTNYQNVIVGKGNTNSYAQLNIQNNNAGTTASSDVVATSNNGTESVNYIDMGINSGGNTSTGVLGGANTAYLYSTGSNFSIGNSTAGKSLMLFTTASTVSNERMRIDSSGNVGIGTTTPYSKLQVNGSVAFPITNATSNITLDATNYTVILSSGSPSVTLPAASSTTNEGRIYIIVNNTNAARTISSYQGFGGGAATTVAANSSITIQSYNFSWYRIQ